MNARTAFLGAAPPSGAAGPGRPPATGDAPAGSVR
jgi:hypothetical protein